MSINDEIKYEEKCVAFLDILGFRELIYKNHDESIKIIATINETFRHALDILHKYSPSDMFSTKLFSDCICLSCDLHNMQYLLYELSFLQYHFSINKMFLRGALTIGPHYENENIIFSAGLIKAYELEKEAVYPRIIVDSVIVDRMSGELDRDYLMQAPDGFNFIDYLYIVTEHEYAVEPELELEAHKTSILEQINTHLKNPKVLEKYKWLSDYHNQKAYKCIGGEADWDEDYYKELVEKLIIDNSIFPSFSKEF